MGLREFANGTGTLAGFYASSSGPPGGGLAQCSRSRVRESLPESAELTQELSERRE
jgi:hypothetical protein